jgi:TolB protein
MIAFSSNRDGDYDIYVMNVGSAVAPTQLTFNSSGDYYPDWSPDGSRIAFTNDGEEFAGEIYVMNVDGSGLVRLTNSPGFDGGPDWSPGGGRIAFQHEGAQHNHDVFSMNPDGTAWMRMTADPAWDGSPAWSPDGSLFAFATRRDDPDPQNCNLCADEIYSAYVDLSAGGNLTSSATGEGSPAWQPLGALRGDMNCDGQVNAVDSLFILRQTAGLPVTQPQGCPEIGS